MHEPIDVMGIDGVCHKSSEGVEGYQLDTPYNTNAFEAQTQEDNGRESLGDKDSDGRPVPRASLRAVPRDLTPKKRRVNTEEGRVSDKRPIDGVGDVLCEKAKAADRYCSLYFGKHYELYRKSSAGASGTRVLFDGFLGFVKDPQFRGKLDNGGLFIIDSENLNTTIVSSWYFAMYATFLPGSTFGVWNASEVMDAYKDNLHEASNTYQVLCVYLGDVNVDDMSKQRIEHFFYSLSAILSSRRKAVTVIVNSSGSLYNTKTLDRIRKTFTNHNRIG